ncbi:MAG: helix-turn-helix transcriptional regulator [Lachnospiraceae bacterium]|nr:helix-turn-helix transcriptional regulator [Lachnospiraceae bacterium]
MSEFYELSYGEVLYELRTYHGYKQKDISDYLNITSQAYSNYENNKRTPDVETMYKIACFYKITIDTLIKYRFTKQIEDSRNYGTLYRGVTDSGITLPLTAKQAKMVTDILSLSEEQQDACQKLINFMKNPIS